MAHHAEVVVDHSEFNLKAALQRLACGPLPPNFKLRLRGRGSGHYEVLHPVPKEAPVPLMLAITGAQGPEGVGAFISVMQAVLDHLQQLDRTWILMCHARGQSAAKFLFRKGENCRTLNAALVPLMRDYAHLFHPHETSRTSILMTTMDQPRPIHGPAQQSL